MTAGRHQSRERERKTKKKEKKEERSKKKEARRKKKEKERRETREKREERERSFQFAEIHCVMSIFYGRHLQPGEKHMCVVCSRSYEKARGTCTTCTCAPYSLRATHELPVHDARCS